MNCFADVTTFSGENDPDDFQKLNPSAAHVVLKRRRDSHRELPGLPPGIELIYMVRHPLEALTSKHPAHHRRFYVSERRWRSEYDSLKALRAAQPERRILYIRYDDLVTTPDIVQARIANNLNLQIVLPFSSSGVPISTASLHRYKEEPYRRLYVRLLPNDFKVEMKEFCELFGFQLPYNFVGPSSRIADSLRRLAVWNMQKEWWRP